MTVLTLHHRDILAPGTVAHLTRATLSAARPKLLHCHDFHELVWVQNGTLRHHLPDGVTTLTEGALVCLSPGHSHGLQGKGEAALVATLCLHPDVVADLLTRFPALSGVFPRAAPAVFYRDIKQMATLNQSAIALERSPRDALAATAFLLPLLSDLAQSDLALPPDCPDWLREACRAARNPAVFRDGAAGLVALTGKAHPHVSRTMRRFLGQTPSDYINHLRMAHAARALVTDIEPLASIADDCGIPNLSHFHKLFRASHGMTPLKYRQRYQRAVLQP